jgi:hypothetical protein
VEAIRKGCEIKKKSLRACCVNSEFLATDSTLKWLEDTPYDIRDEALNDVSAGGVTT